MLFDDICVQLTILIFEWHQKSKKSKILTYLRKPDEMIKIKIMNVSKKSENNNSYYQRLNTMFHGTCLRL